MPDTGAASSPSADKPLVALTGATGFLGSHIADRLLVAGYGVRASVRPTSDRRWLAGKPVETRTVRLAPPLPGSNREDDGLRKFTAGAVAVIHCAGAVKASDLAAYRRANVATTERLLAAATAEPACRTFLLISSLAATGPATLDRPAREDSPCRPITGYGRSKLEAEQLLQADESPLRKVILRPPALYGPRDVAFVPLLRYARRGWTAQVGGRPEGLSLVDGRDAAAAALALLECPEATGPYFVDDGRAYTWAEFVSVLAEVCGRRVHSLRLPLWPLRLFSRLAGRRLADRILLLNRDRLADLSAPGWVCDGARLRATTGFSATYDLRRGLAEALAFHLDRKWL